MGVGKFMAAVLLALACVGSAIAAEGESVDRVKKAEAKWGVAGSAVDRELALAKDRLIYGEVLAGDDLPDKRKALAIIAALTASQGFDDLREWVASALKVGLKPVEVREIILQCAPYAGYPRAQAAMKIAYEVFSAAGVKTPLENMGTVNEETRLNDGLNVQRKIFGAERIDEMRNKAPADQKEIVANYLSAWCFGDFYARKGLDLRERELVTFCAIVALGGCDPQAKAHAAANISVGNTKKDLVGALAVMAPFIGFPRTLNGLGMVNQAVPEAK